ncbi:hypothetical protein AAIE21_22590 [Paenibacillus sp. 102]
MKKTMNLSFFIFVFGLIIFKNKDLRNLISKFPPVRHILVLAGEK